MSFNLDTVGDNADILISISTDPCPIFLNVSELGHEREACYSVVTNNHAIIITSVLLDWLWVKSDSYVLKVMMRKMGYFSKTVGFERKEIVYLLRRA